MCLLLFLQVRCAEIITGSNMEVILRVRVIDCVGITLNVTHDTKANTIKLACIAALTCCGPGKQCAVSGRVLQK